jgi:hypothetical protein
MTRFILLTGLSMLGFAFWGIARTHLPALEPASLFTHLQHVNAQWAAQQNLGTEMQATVAFDDDRCRIQRHLQQVSVLLHKGHSANDAAQGQRRMLHLAHLDAYTQQKTFPINMLHRGRRPYFRDHLGTLCAVGYLLWQDGQHDLVNRIVREDNYGYLYDLAKKYPQIGEWASANGFALSELALIQPTYQAPEPKYQPWTTISTGGRINAMLNIEDKDLYVAGKFDKIGGLSVNNIARWDGQKWYKVADGVIGEVHCMIEVFGHVYIGGQFYLPGEPLKQNIAAFDPKTGKIQGLQTGDMGGAVRTMALDFFVYIGGDFTKVNGKANAFLARNSKILPPSDSWEDDPDFVVDAPVRSIINAQGTLLIGGEFKLYGKDKKPAHHIAYYDSGNFKWLSGLEGPHGKVTQMAFHNNVLWVGGASQSFNAPVMHSLIAGLWQPVEAAQTPFNSGGAVCGFAVHNGALMAYGKYDWQPFFGNSGSGLAPVGGTGYIPTLIANDSITAATVFQNKLMLGGAFTKLHNKPFERTALIPLQTSGTGDPLGINIRIWSDNQHITINSEDASALQFQLFDLSGRIILQKNYDAGGSFDLIPCADLPAGVYGYSAVQNGIRKTGKLVLGL